MSWPNWTIWRKEVVDSHASATRPKHWMGIGMNLNLFSNPLQLNFRPSFSPPPNVGDHDGDVSETKITERQQKILNLIKESPTISGRQMSEKLSVSQRTIERDLSALQKSGILKHEGKDNDGVWVVLE